MVTTIETPTAVSRRDALIKQLLQAATGVWDIFGVYLGDQLGLYRTLAGIGAATSVELASASDLAERYVREWLEQQTASGILAVANPEADPTARRFRLPDEHDEVLTERESLNFMAPLGQIVVGTVGPIHAVLAAFRTGGGVPYAD